MVRRVLKIIMTILFLLGVVYTTCIYLPNSVKTDSKAMNFVMQENEENATSDVALSEKKVVIDCGHGGFDPGKESKSGIKEKDINLIIGKKLKSLLESKGIGVIMTRTDDSGLYKEDDSNKKAADMKARCAIINESGADIVVSIHQNSFESPGIKGAQVFYYKHSVQGKKLAGIIQNILIEQVDPNNHRVEKSDTSYYMLVHTDIPTVIAECGFLSNPQEAELLNSQDYQDKIAQALCNGIIEYLLDS